MVDTFVKKIFGEEMDVYKKCAKVTKQINELLPTDSKDMSILTNILKEISNSENVVAVPQRVCEYPSLKLFSHRVC